MSLILQSAVPPTTTHVWAVTYVHDSLHGCMQLVASTQGVRSAASVPVWTALVCQRKHQRELCPVAPNEEETHMKNSSRVSLILISLSPCLSLHAHQLFHFQSCGTFPGNDFPWFSQRPSLLWQCFPFNVLSPLFPHWSFPVDAARCLVCAGALEQAAGTFTASCLSQTAPVLTRPIWQCGSGYTELTERVTLLDLDFASPFSSLQGKSTARSASPTSYPC